MWILFLLLPVFTGTVDLTIGVIVDTRMAKAQSVMKAALQDMKTSNSTSYTINSKFDGSGTCTVGPNHVKAGFFMAEYFTFEKMVAAFGPMCHGDHRIAGRLSNIWDILYFSTWNENQFDYKRKTLVQMTTRSTTNTAANILSFMKGADWKKIAVFSCLDCYPNEADENAIMTKERLANITGILRLNGIMITLEKTVTKDSTVEDYQKVLQGIDQVARVILPFLGTTMASYTNLHLAMRAENLSHTEYFTLLVFPDFKVDGLDTPWKQDTSLQDVFQGAIVLYNDMNRDTASSKLVTEFIQNVGIGNYQQTYIELYEAISVFNAMMSVYQFSENQLFSGKAVLQAVKGQVKGPFGPSVYFDKQYRRISPYLVYQVSNGTLTDIGKMTHSMDHEGKLSCFDGNDLCLQFSPQKPLAADQPTCGFHAELCDQSGTIFVIVAVVLTVTAGVLLFVFVKRVRSNNGGSEKSAMPWIIPFTSVRVVDMSRLKLEEASVASLQRQMEDAAIQKESVAEGRLLAIVSQQYCTVERYLQREKISFPTDDGKLFYEMKQLNHDNLNAFIGMTFDRSTHLYILWNHAFRGTLADWIFAKKDARVSFAEKNFKDAFVRDILKGLDYLHTSIGYHGSLTPYQCFIDTHWILKISGFAISRVLFRWKNNNSIATLDGSPLIPNNQLHYYAPELRRKIKSILYTNRTELLNLTTQEGQAADMYAYGAIMFEILHKRRMMDIDDYGRSEPEDDGFIMCEHAEALLPSSPPAIDDMDKDVHNDIKQLIVSCWATDITARADIIMARKIAEATMKMSGSLVDQMLKNMRMYTDGLEALVAERTGQLEEAQKKADGLLSEMLPKSIAQDLKKGIQIEARVYKSVTIMYSDIVGFTSLCSESLPMEVVELLGQLFYNFDSIIKEHDGYKMETIGDAYCVASGMPIETKLRHVSNIAFIALKQRKFMTEFEIPHRPGNYLHCRWGFNTGSLFSGVIGRRAPRYACFGETVSLAAKMENLGIPDKIQMTFQSFKMLSTHFPEFIVSKRDGGSVKVQGQGHYLTYWLDGVEELLRTDRAAFEKALEEHESRDPPVPKENPYTFYRTPTSASSLSNVKYELEEEETSL